MSEAATSTAAPTSTVVEFEFPNLPKQSFDCAVIPAGVRFDFLKTGVRQYIANRLNGVHTRHKTSEAVAAWNAWDEASAADPLQSVVAKPEGERPIDPDYQDAYNRAIADLTSGNVRKQGSEPKVRKTKDPLVSLVSEAVAREVYESKRTADPKYTYIKAKAEVGDGIAYLNALIDAKVAAGGDRAGLEKMRETKYLNPARAMLGITTTKAASELPSIL